MIAIEQKTPLQPARHPDSVHSARRRIGRFLAAAILPAIYFLAGCGGGSASGSSNGLTVSPGSASIDTNCTGCNSTTSSGYAVEQFTATSSSGSTGTITWSVSGGDASVGAGTITSAGLYTPPSYLTADSVTVTVTATSSAGASGSTTLKVTPGFLQPLSPENVALGTNGTVSIKGYIAEAGGSTGIAYTVSNTSTGSSGGQGSVNSPSCSRSSSEFTSCTVTYTAPGTVSSTAASYVVASVGSAKIATEVLLNTAGINSNPSTHQTQLSTPVSMGSSGGNNNDYDTTTYKGQTYITDCCGGTLGALVQNSSGTKYILSCNHVLARSDQALLGSNEVIVQPGLIDAGCYPSGSGGTETQVGTLTAWLPLSSNATNADAAIAQINSSVVDTTGAIQELGAKQSNGALAAAPPGISSTNGTGESGSLNLLVAKSGRTTGLTCASIAYVNLDVQVSYYKDCGETSSYLTKTFTNQIAIEGNNFSDAGDSGSLVVDVSNAEPVGLFYAGGENSSGVGEGIANPAPTVLAELNALQGATYTYVGTTDHTVNCLDYSNSTVKSAQARTIAAPQAEAAQEALTQARMMESPSRGILRTTVGKSSDHPGEATVIFYVDQNSNVAVPQTVNGVRTEVIRTTQQSLAAGTVPAVPAQIGSLPSLAPAVLSHAASVKQQIGRSLMQQNPAFFGVGVGQSLDNPQEAALAIFVDRHHVPASLPATIEGMRTRYIIMDRLHVTKSYLNGPVRQQGHCMPHAAQQRTSDLDPFHLNGLHDLKLF